jgi:hypothetical protein
VGGVGGGGYVFMTLRMKTLDTTAFYGVIR